jgi:hypothetical protein
MPLVECEIKSIHDDLIFAPFIGSFSFVIAFLLSRGYRLESSRMGNFLANLESIRGHCFNKQICGKGYKVMTTDGLREQIVISL